MVFSRVFLLFPKKIGITTREEKEMFLMFYNFINSVLIKI